MKHDSERDARLSKWMTDSQNGDKAAYDNLLQEISAILTPFFLRRLMSMDAAADVVQDTLISIHTARHTYDPSKPFLPWMFAIGRCRLIDYWRRHERHMACEPIEGVLEAQLEEDNNKEPVTFVHDALNALAPNDRDVIRYLKLEGRSIKEVADLMKITEAAVKVRAHRAYQRLRERFEAIEDGYK